MAQLRLGPGLRLPAGGRGRGGPAADVPAALACGDRRDPGQRGRCRRAAPPDDRHDHGLGGREHGGTGRGRLVRAVVLPGPATRSWHAPGSDPVRRGRRGARPAGGRADRGLGQLAQHGRLVARAGAGRYRPDVEKSAAVRAGAARLRGGRRRPHRPGPGSRPRLRRRARGGGPAAAGGHADDGSGDPRPGYRRVLPAGRNHASTRRGLV